MSGKAIVGVEKGKVEIRDVEKPNVKEGYVLIKVTAVGLNPADWKGIEYKAAPGLRFGADYAGVVEELGPGVTKFKKGDRITGIVHGGNELEPNVGSFGEYTLGRADLQFKIPDNLTNEQAATIGVSTITVAQGLYKRLELPWPTSPTPTPFPILIHGGSTATGVQGIQYAKASGLTVIATSSPHNFELLKSLGADTVFDYRSPTAGAEIRALTRNELTLAWDCVGTGAELVAHALSDALPSKYASIMPVDAERVHAINPKVQGPVFHIGYDVFGEPYMFMGNPVPVKEDEHENAVRFLQVAAELLGSGKVRTIRTVENFGGKGLEGVLLGLRELREKGVSAGKFVYTI
ncbi:alcohol dehydrogenase [Annulohypoxylon maeteangense]|uniref:alcohol dehydrogenase n=1 Tax=Annulohypoxylon maeteangense TaxID=1927788 RepID=UPI0020077FBB|nr:alcohol dehydrogenase [Annulohypoxylon maeteangense]KAI0889732.1 alcohol dehydrogenase [Annulohypoxylon maeteangense]